MMNLLSLQPGISVIDDGLSDLKHVPFW